MMNFLYATTFRVASVQPSALHRAKPALRYLRVMLAQCECPVECIAVFPDRCCENRKVIGFAASEPRRARRALGRILTLAFARSH
jgi:hypothetical protein